ncbi:MAG TPA: UDP-N-acetylmuramoyl-L-alanine--D-glutamate ligase [Pseudomonadales bacterium]|nr:UDP-N-acetylmuramoyl-L-alanine--D-glutamate ligase [Pseudomonadales bacterium]
MTASVDRYRELDAVVLGLGATGESLVRHLRPRVARLRVLDSRAEPPGRAALAAAFPDVPVQAGPFDADLVLSADLVAVSPGIAADEPLLVRAREAGIDVAGDIELFARAVEGAPIAAITGTNGKSTVTDLLGAMLAADGRDVAVGGNLGTPALDLLDARPRDGFVLELSSFQLDLVTRIDLSCAAILNLSPDHLDRYGSMAAYAASKQRIYAHARAAVFNGDDPATQPPPDFAGRQIAVRLAAPGNAQDWGLTTDDDGRVWLAGAGRARLPMDELPIAGRHNAFNVLAALAMAEVLGVDGDAAIAAVRAYRPLPHRCIPVAVRAGVRYIDDSKATNIGACRAALEGLDDGSRRLVLIAGGLGKGADFAELRAPVAAHVRAAILIGTDAQRMAAALDGACELVHAADMDDAVRRAAALAQRGDTVLLAPACASFDMFSSYGQRGDRFVAAVAALGEGDA